MRQSRKTSTYILQVPSESNSDVLIKLRLWFFTIAFTHLSVMSVKLLGIDFRESENPDVWIYQNFKWKLLTCWFNLASLVYLPVSIYCDWRALRRETDSPHIMYLQSFRLIVFTGIIMPCTAFADILFWRLWNVDRELVAPAAVDSLVPYWTQHCMHTVSLVVALVDLILVPRQRPKSLVPAFMVMNVFLILYSIVCVYSITQGEYIYPVFKIFSVPKLALLLIFVFLEHSFYYNVQWIIIDLIWGERRYYSNKNELQKESKSSDFSSFLVDAASRVMPILGLSKSAS